jgi:hypothetical protein
MFQRCISLISCWSLLIIILVCSVQMTISSLNPSGDWIEMVADGMGEEEAEDTETEEESKKREYNKPQFAFGSISEPNSKGTFHATDGYQSVFGEVFSPPPEA